MSNTVFNLVRERYPDGGSKYNLLLAMATRADDKGGSIYESVETLAMHCRTDPRQIQRTLRKLEEEGIIQAVSSKKGGRQKSTRYCIRLDALLAFPLYANVYEANKAGIPLDEWLSQKGGESAIDSDDDQNKGRRFVQETPADSPPKTLTTDINKNNNNARGDLFGGLPVEEKPRKRFAYDKDMPVPEDFCVTAELYAWADDKGYQNIDRHLDLFMAHYGANGAKHKDWQRAFQKWVIKDAQFAANRQATNQQRQTYKSRAEQQKEEFNAYRDELYRSAKQPYGQQQQQLERDPRTIDFIDAEFNVVDEDPPCPF